MSISVRVQEEEMEGEEEGEEGEEEMDTQNSDSGYLDTCP